MSNDEFFDKVGTDMRQKKSNNRSVSGDLSQDDPNVDDSTKRLKGGTTGDKKRWGQSGDLFYSINSTHEIMPTGLYACKMVNGIGIAFEQKDINVDDLIIFPDSDTDKIIDEFNEFWRIESEFVKRGFVHKRGFLLHGPPGSGKTSCLQLLIKTLIEEYNGICVMIDNPDWGTQALSMLRKVEPVRPIIAIIEDLDALVDRYDEDDFLSLLDGENQINNVIFVATTNYPQRLDPRFIDRPSRFDTIEFIDMPNPMSRKIYLQTKEPSLKGDELKKWVKASSGFSIAHLKEMIISVKCFHQDFEEVVKRLKQMKRRELSSDKYEGGKAIGFMNTDEDKEEDYDIYDDND